MPGFYNYDLTKSHDMEIMRAWMHGFISNIYLAPNQDYNLAKETIRATIGRENAIYLMVTHQGFNPGGILQAFIKEIEQEEKEHQKEGNENPEA